VKNIIGKFYQKKPNRERKKTIAMSTAETSFDMGIIG
jgi:hypothetical protein